MMMSRRAQRMDRHHDRAKRSPGFNLVALMDIFTILVFFLLVNSVEVQEIPFSQDVDLPESIIDTRPREAVVVKVAREDILVDGQLVESVAAAMATEELVLGSLRQALGNARRNSRTGDQVTIMGDRHISYDLLRKLMATCADAGFSEVSLAVLQRSTGGGE